MDSALPGITQSMNIQALSNGFSITRCENVAPNNIPDSLAPLHIIGNSSESIENMASNNKPSEVDENSISLISTKILEIIFDYALNKFDDCRDRLEAGRTKFISVLNNFVRRDARVDMCLPAFPFKSANKVYKAFGFLPDKAEEIAMARLHDMCRRIEEIYSPGAQLVIVSDGLVYNGLLQKVLIDDNR
jgi:hypothetical protein